LEKYSSFNELKSEKNILEICKMLNQHGVEYLIVGGTPLGK